MGWTAVLVYSSGYFLDPEAHPVLNVVASFPEEGTEGAWNAIASSMLSLPGSTCLGMSLDCALRPLSRAKYEILLTQSIPVFPSFSTIFTGDLNKFSLPAVPSSRVSSRGKLLIWLNMLVCKKQCQDMVSMAALKMAPCASAVKA